MTPTDHTFEILNLVVISISAFFVWLTLSNTNRWNRKKGSQEILERFTSGEIPELNKKIRMDFNCKVYDKNHDYTTFIQNLSPNKVDEFDDILLRILNIFEVIAINMKNSIIIENVCFDYLGWFYTEYYRFSKPLIDQKRIAANDKRVLGNFERYAIRWQKKINKK